MPARAPPLMPLGKTSHSAFPFGSGVVLAVVFQTRKGVSHGA
jgi:hypothetical protein